MNQKDYKEIAGIMKIGFDNLRCYKPHLRGIIRRVLENIVNKQADYFEREVKTRFPNIANSNMHFEFDREQFLSNCGVD